jgi:hypothetical protein
LQPTVLQERLQKDLEERRLLKKQIEEGINKQRAAEQSMQDMRRKAAEDVLKAEQMMSDARQLSTEVNSRFNAVQIEEQSNRDRKFELDEMKRSLDHREQVIDLKQAKLDQSLKNLREQMI